MTNCYLSIKNIDKFRRSFFWRGKPPNQISGGHCLVNWATCLRPRKWGGLGFKDLEKFVNGIGGVWGGGGQERQWKNLFQITDSTDRALFFNSTIIQIGNGKVTPFWEARWVHGPAPKDIAPGLYKAARFKKRSVCDELRNSSWIKNLQVIQDPDLLDEYVQLYMALSTIQ
jgi:hypothetical protein